MYEYIEGKVDYANPAFAVIENNGIGYHLQISLYTYEKLKSLKQAKLLIHLAIKEDAHTLYGFIDEEERQLFRNLITVNGVGTNTARMILSSQNPSHVIQAIGSGNVNTLKAVKGVGPKTAQRIIIELQDKIMKSRPGYGISDLPGSPGSSSGEALLALMALGFQRNSAEKAIQTVQVKEPGIGVEDLLKAALKIL